MVSPTFEEDQQWRIRTVRDGVYSVQNIGSNRYMEVPFAGCAKGENVATHTRSNRDHHRWVITKEGEDYFFQPAHCLTQGLDKNRRTNGNVHTWTFSNTNGNQRWKLIPINANSRTVRVNTSFDATPIKGRKSELFWIYNQTREVDQYVIQYATELGFECNY